MRIAVLDTYYAKFLAAHYAAHDGLAAAPSDKQLRSLLAQGFGTSDFYSRHLTAMGVEAFDLIANCEPLQASWAREHRVRFSELALRVPHRFFRVPLAGRWLASLPGLTDVAIEQVKELRPDILYCQDLSFFTPTALRELKQYVRLIVGQIACPLPPNTFVQAYDLILTSFPHYVDRIRSLGVNSEYFRIGFDTRVLEMLGPTEADIPVSFVGGISPHHGNAVPLLEALAEKTPIKFFGYGAHSLPGSSPIRARHNGEVWGVDMYRALARSRITINRHIGVAENYANNMRLYEATGVGALLITDKKDNLGDLFDVGREVIAYNSQDEAIELVRYYDANPEKARAIARAGQQRTLLEHTYRHRMAELVPILDRYLS